MSRSVTRERKIMNAQEVTERGAPRGSQIVAIGDVVRYCGRLYLVCGEEWPDLYGRPRVRLCAMGRYPHVAAALTTNLEITSVPY